MRNLIDIILSGFEHFTEKTIPSIRYAVRLPFAKAGIVSAQLSIADILYDCYWYWEPENPEKWLEKALEQKNPRAFVMKGHFLRYKARRIWDEEFEEMRRTENSEENNPDNEVSQKAWKNRCEENEILQKKLLFEAIDCYKAAADMNYARGQYWLYYMYDDSACFLGLKKSGISYLRQAAENGCPEAQAEMAEKCLKHDDLVNGVKWMKKAADAPKSHWGKEYFNVNRKDARKWYRRNKHVLEIRKAALKGDPKALFDYAEYFLGDSYKRNSLAESHMWHTKAAEAGYPKAMEEEGSFIIHGWVPGSLEDAFSYYTKAYDAGCRIASWGLGDCWYYGWGTERNLDKAKYYYRIAKRCGVGINMKFLNKMTEDEFLKIDCEKALKKDRDFYN